MHVCLLVDACHNVFNYVCVYTCKCISRGDALGATPDRSIMLVAFSGVRCKLISSRLDIGTTP